MSIFDEVPCKNGRVGLYAHTIVTSAGPAYLLYCGDCGLVKGRDPSKPIMLARSDKRAVPIRAGDEKPRRPIGEPRPVRKRSLAGQTRKQIIIDRDGFDGCRYCGLRGKLTYEHLVPSVRGGADGHSNLGLSCSSCNAFKGQMTEPELLCWLRTGEIPDALSVGDRKQYASQAVRRKTMWAGFVALCEHLETAGASLHRNSLWRPNG